MGPVGVDSLTYLPLRVLAYPQEPSQVLELLVRKERQQNVRYVTQTYRRVYYERQRSKFENGSMYAVMAAIVLAIGHQAGQSEDPDPNAIAAGIAFGVGFSWLIASRPPPRRWDEPVPGSERDSFSYQTRRDTLPASGELLVVRAADTVRTDAAGIAAIRVPLSAYDVGVRIRHTGSDQPYVVRRIRKGREVTADWVRPLVTTARVAGSIESIAQTIARLRAGVGLKPVVIWLVVSAVVGEILEFVIEEIGTRTEHYYDWVIVRER